MLVYANHISLTGHNPALQILRAVSGWCSEKFNQRFIVRDIKTPGEHSGGDPFTRMKICSAEGEGFVLYSWVLKHSDANITGRQWVTELGLRDNGNSAEFSCVVYTDEKSILVSDPVQVSRPRIMRYLMDNVQSEPDIHFGPETIGIDIKWTGDTVDSYRGLLAEIESSNRAYPLVLVSPDHDGHYFVKPEKLQATLFGLAQVVGIDARYNSYEMEEIMGRRYSAWSGALNFISAPHRDGRVFTQLILPRDFPDDCTTSYRKELFVLGIISHSTNIPRQRHRIRPEGVLALSTRQRIDKRIKTLSEKPDSTLREELGMVYEEMNTLSNELEILQIEKESVELSLLECEEKTHSLEKELKVQAYVQSQLNQPSNQSSKNNSDIISDLIDFASRNQDPTPVQCLDILAKAFPEHLVILPSAIESAHEVSGFQQTRRLLDMLHRLITEYLPLYLDEGDNEARKVFTNNEYAARESETVVNNKHYMKYRIFNYNDTDVEMARHLRVGVADDPTATIRVHFDVDRTSRKIVIGHCGYHLPLPGR